MAAVNQASVASHEEEISRVWERGTFIRDGGYDDFFCASAKHMEASKGEGILMVIGGHVTTVNKEKRQRVVERNLQDEEMLLDVEDIRSFPTSDIVSSKWKDFMENPRPNWKDATGILMICMAVGNGARASTLQFLISKDVTLARSLDDRQYYSYAIAKHKTSDSYGAAVLTVSAETHKMALCYLYALSVLFGGSSNDGFLYKNPDGSLVSLSSVNKYVKKAWKIAKLPTEFTMTKLRKFTPVYRGESLGETEASSIANLLNHSLATSNRFYTVREVSCTGFATSVKLQEKITQRNSPMETLAEDEMLAMGL